MEMKIVRQHAEQFTAELWKHITDTGFGSQSKNDFYDYVLYLFNKYDEGHFLTTSSVYDLSQLLKVTNLKVTNTIENITLKYYRDTDKSEIPLKFLSGIAEGKIKTEDKGENYIFVVEDKRVRNYLDSILKKEQGITFDLHLNSEKIVLTKKQFFTLCRGVIADYCAKTGGDPREAEKDITEKEQAENRKQLVQALFKGLDTAAQNLPFHAKEIIGTLSTVWKYFRNRQAQNAKEN